MTKYNSSTYYKTFNISSLIEHENLRDLIEAKKGLFQEKLDSKPEAGEVYKIPASLHYVWFTSSSSPREISKNDIENVLHNHKLFSETNPEWKSIIHVNDKNLVPESVATLESNGISVEELKESIVEPAFFETIDALISQKHWGLASDYTRYKVMIDGGVYSDLNFKAMRNIDVEMKTYDFFAQDCINYFFAAKPNHPIVEELYKKVQENLNNPPAYIQEIDSGDIFTKTVVTSLLPFCMSYLNNAHQDNNQDIIFPSSNGYFLIEEGKSFPEEDSYWSITRLNNAFGHLDEYSLVGVDGADGSHVTWIEA